MNLSYCPTIVGHRGAPLCVTENTMASFERAKADGATTVECDVHLSKDGTPIIMHDDTIDRMALPGSAVMQGAIAEFSDACLATARLVDNHAVPHLMELLGMTDVELYVEVKVAEAAKASAQLMNDLRPDNGAHDTVISFVPEALAAVRDTARRVQLGLLLEKIEPEAWDLIEELGCQWVSIWIDAITPAAADEARRRGLKINVWTVNSIEQLNKAVALAPDSISTDDPAWAIRELQARGVVPKQRATPESR